MKGADSKHGAGLNRQGVRNLDQGQERKGLEVARAEVARIDAIKQAEEELALELDRLRKDPLAGDPMLKHFRFRHLPNHLRIVSRQWAQLAVWTVKELPRNPERTVALRKLLEGKDAAVRTLVPEE